MSSNTIFPTITHRSSRPTTGNAPARPDRCPPGGRSAPVMADYASYPPCDFAHGRMEPDRRASLTQNPPARIDSHCEWANPSNNAIATANFSTMNFGAPAFIGAI